MDDADVPAFNSPRDLLSEEPQEKPKWVTSKTNAVKEIEEWATDSLAEGLTHELARTTGQLPDNVTEARMLKAKIYELSKERYKFKTQTQFEKKMFLDRQQRKTAYLKDLMRGVTIDANLRRQSWTAPTRERSGSSTSSVGTRSVSARMSFLNRMDVSRCNDRPKEVLQAEEQLLRDEEEKLERARVRMPLIKSASAPGGRRKKRKSPKSAKSTSSVTSSLYSTEPGLKRSNTSPSMYQKLPDVKIEASGTIPIMQVDFPDNDGTLACGPPPVAQRQNLLRKREEERSKSKVHFAELPSTRAPTPKKRKGPIQDSRFYSLTNALSGTYTCDKPQEISKIVQGIEALHTQPKHPKDSRPKVAKKIKEYMRSRGFVF